MHLQARPQLELFIASVIKLAVRITHFFPSGEWFTCSYSIHLESGLWDCKQQELLRTTLGKHSKLRGHVTSLAPGTARVVSCWSGWRQPSSCISDFGALPRVQIRSLVPALRSQPQLRLQLQVSRLIFTVCKWSFIVSTAIQYFSDYVVFKHHLNTIDAPLSLLLPPALCFALCQETVRDDKMSHYPASSSKTCMSFAKLWQRGSAWESPWTEWSLSSGQRWASKCSKPILKCHREEVSKGEKFLIFHKENPVVCILLIR